MMKVYEIVQKQIVANQEGEVPRLYYDLWCFCQSDYGQT